MTTQMYKDLKIPKVLYKLSNKRTAVAELCQFSDFCKTRNLCFVLYSMIQNYSNDANA